MTRAPEKTRSHVTTLLLALTALGVTAASGCLERPVSPLQPDTSNIFVNVIQQARVNKIDLLFMIDNSRSMADKQEILALAVPDLVSRLVNPVCLAMDGSQSTPPGSPDDDCPAGSEREFPPIKDIHIGIITSSLGGRGADSCTVQQGVGFDFSQNDGGRLISRADPMGTSVSTYGGLGFLAWDPDQKLEPPGESLEGGPGAGGLVGRFVQMVQGAGEMGCGFESSLEAWYRFLVDPDPYERIDRVECFPGDTNNSCASRAGSDDVLLQQRRDFLRPDSLLAVVMLTDENDCSVIDDGQFFISLQSAGGPGQQFHLPRATDICATDPDDPCCYSCGVTAPPGCPPASAFPNCSVNGGSYDDTSNDDRLNLRCFDQKRRFGIDFLYPVDRYVKGLLDPTVPDRDGNLVPNPIYSNLQGTDVAVRDDGLVFLAGIIGVPWQLIDDEDQSTDDDLSYLAAEEIRKRGLWDAIVGACPGSEVDGKCDVARAEPTEPLMRETYEERVNVPAGPAGAATQPSTASSPAANPINGHEWNIALKNDLQYACTFPLRAPRPSSDDCSSSNPPPDVEKKPLCQDPNTGAYGQTQFLAKAFPTTRQLEVLKGFGDNSIVASICARNVVDPSKADFGYRPAIGAIVDRLKDVLDDRCLPRPLDYDREDNSVSCAVVEAAPRRGGDCNCLDPERPLGPASSQIQIAATNKLEEGRRCGEATGTSCDAEFCFCQICPAGAQFDSSTGKCEFFDTTILTDCRTSQQPGASTNGWCYVDPPVTGVDSGGQPTAEFEAQSSLVANCNATARRKLRFAGTGQAQPGATLFVACVGDTL